MPTPPRNPRTRQSSPTSSRMTALEVPIIDTSFGVATTASAAPSAHDVSASSPLSINAC